MAWAAEVYFGFWSIVMLAFWLLLWWYGRRIVGALREIHKALKKDAPK